MSGRGLTRTFGRSSPVSSFLGCKIFKPTLASRSGVSFPQIYRSELPRAASQQRSGDATSSETSSRGNKMSNHLLLKPSSSSSLYRETDFRITGPNVELDQVRKSRSLNECLVPSPAPPNIFTA